MLLGYTCEWNNKGEVKHKPRGLKRKRKSSALVPCAKGAVKHISKGPNCTTNELVPIYKTYGEKPLAITKKK